MVDFEIRRHDRHCSSTGNELQPGESFYSALVEKTAGDVVRLDFSESAWTEPPENCVGWWKSQIPEKNSNRVYWAPNAVIMNYFLELKDKPESAEVFYVLSLLMVRKRILRMDEIDKEPVPENPDATAQFLILTDTKSDTEFRVPVVTPSTQRINEIHQQLCELLFSDEPPDLDEMNLEGDSE